jgi:hypothetical protein
MSKTSESWLARQFPREARVALQDNSREGRKKTQSEKYIPRIRKDAGDVFEAWLT